MVSLETFYENVRVVTDNTESSIKVKKQLDKVVTRLGDEKQFDMVGSIYIGQRDLMQKFLVKSSIVLRTGDPRNVSVKDGNNFYEICEVLEDSTCVITLVTDNLDGKSDDYIMGLIAYKFSEWSRLWRKMTEIPNWDSLENSERIAMVNKLSHFKFPLGTKEREEYERSVDEEINRLGFSKEVAAYDLKL